MGERIAVVGHAAVTCLGRDLESTWDALVAGRSGLRRQPAFDPARYRTDVLGLVEGFGPGSAAEDPAVAKLEVRAIHLAMAAARDAWADAGLSAGDFDPERVALVVGSAFGGLDLLDHEAQPQRRRGLTTNPYLVPGLIINQGLGQIAQHLGLRGPGVAPANACASGGHAIALGAMLLRAGAADLALCGAAESALAPAIVNGFATMRALFTRRCEQDRSWSDPAQASRPFSVDRAGFVLAEGAGMLVLARDAVARRLGLSPRAELAGWGMNSDGHHMAIPEPGSIARCLERALADAGVRPEQVDYYNAHGTATPVNDRVETQAIKDVFGPHARRLPVSSIKGALGHALGAAPAIEAAVCVRALVAQVIPPTVHHRPDPELDLDFVPGQGRPAALTTVLSASFGFGGTNNALVLRSWSDA